MINPRNTYHIPTIVIDGMEQDSSIPELIHCYITDDMPVGQRLLWGVEYAIKPINLQHMDSNNLMIELATIDPDEKIGERIISRFLFKSFFVTTIYKKIISIERKFAGGGIRPILQTTAYSIDLKNAFREIFWLIDGHDGMVEDRETGMIVPDPGMFSPASKRQHISTERYRDL